MPKQTFISNDFFVNAHEDVVKQRILDLPNFVHNIKFLKENTVIQTLKFLYQRPKMGRDNHIEVSFLPLNDHQTKITLRCSNADGSVFSNDPYVKNAMHNFESAIYAALNNDISGYETDEPKIKPFQRILNLLTALVISIGLFYFLKLFVV